MDHVNDDTASVGNQGCPIITTNLYKAAAEGDIESFKHMNSDQLEMLATPIKNTVLHIYIASRKRTERTTEFVQQIVEICPQLLMQVNERGDTPLHLSAKFGHLAIVKVLIQVAKAHRDDVESEVEAAKLQMLRIKNKLGNTALHEAVNNNYSYVVELLTKEDPQYPYSANNYGESPLFTATEFRSLSMVTIILENCQSASYEGPDGKTALHVAVRSNNLDITRKLLEKKSDLIKATDENGWTPLHYAAYYGRFSIVKELLKCDGCVAFVADKERQMTPLHMAAAQGQVKIMNEILSCRPDCCEMVDVRGWNFLHFASASLEYCPWTVFVASNPKFKNLIYAKDIEGNTPLHVCAVCKPPLASQFVSVWKTEVRVDAINKENDSILGTCRYGSPKLQKEIEELKAVCRGPYRIGIIRSNNRFIKPMVKERDTHLIVATLVATVSFAAAFTMPGGLDQGKGTAILTRKMAFQTFIIADTIAMIFSLLAVYLNYSAALNTLQVPLAKVETIIPSFIEIALIAMLIAFVTGTYVVLTPSGLAVATMCIGLSFFVLLYGTGLLQSFYL